MPTFGPSSVGSSFDPKHSAPAAVVAAAALKGLSAEGVKNTAHEKLASAFNVKHVAANHGAPALSHEASGGSVRALNALRHADSFAGGHGAHSYSVSSVAVHDRIFTASHISAVKFGANTTGGHIGHSTVQTHSGASHVTISVGEGTKLLVKDFSPSVGSGHLK